MNAVPITRRREIRRLARLAAILTTLALLASACSSDDDVAARDPEPPSSADPASEDTGETGSDDADGAADDAVSDGQYPMEVETSSGTITIEQRPDNIVSLSPTATEILFAIGAGDRVVAVDLFSNYPEEAPEGTLDGFSPDLEAILATAPDLVVASGLPEDVAAGLTGAGVAVMFQPAAASLDDVHDQVAQLGEATGEVDGAAAVNADIRRGVDAVVASLPEQTAPVRVFHEIDDSFYTATSDSFIGQVYAEMGFENIADPLDDGSGFPLVDGESIIAADPSLIVFTDQVGYSADDIAARPGWDGITAVAEGNIVQVDGDIASRWGPRIVDFMEAIAAEVSVSA